MTTETDIKSTANGSDLNVSAAPKKRRRRTAATGASEDCFTCRKLQTKCDRRRPYCGPCLQVGKDCSGYRTTLTWGVGVASRGKLRGLTCPVAKQTGEESIETKKPALTHKRKASIVKPSKVAKQPTFKPAYEYNGDFTSAPSAGHLITPIKAEEADTEPDHALSLPIPIQSNWDYPAPYQHPLPVPQSHESSLDSNPSLTQLHTSINHSVDSNGFPLSASSKSTFSDADYATPGEFPPSPMPLHYSDSYPPLLGNPFLLQDGQESELASEPIGPFFEGTDHGRSLDFSNSDFPHVVDNVPQYLTEFDTTSDMSMVVNDLDSQQPAKESVGFDLDFPQSLFYSQFFHLPSRMQYLLDYYNKHICSVLVAFDSPINPYRQHVLELATHSEGLQNAIAALAINNMRMRNHLGFVQDLEDSSTPSSEETCYKSVSINRLQMQLTDPRSAQDDSILATLLILCLFHVCDSGFSKFKTQLEGVQKLLSMRDPSLRTGFVGWVEMFFTWFDVMTSTVNDREAEIRGDSLDMMQYSSNLGALEQFSGCDGRLFKLIARLGRLNLLSQDRPVRGECNDEKTPRASPSGSFGRSESTHGRPRRWQKRKVVNPMDFSTLDGNGWGSRIVSAEDDEQVILGDNEHGGAADGRHEFWSEWNDVRARLQSWSMDPLPLASSSQPFSAIDAEQPMEVDQRDMLHINESFRSSALLYTERLAHPHLASSSPNIQDLVRDALAHITSISITSCVNKFLLWPLFIAGTECIDIHHRAIVRDRCLEIMRESGFYNNLSVLGVLERVWAEQGDGGAEEVEVDRRRKDSVSARGGFGQAFRWRRAMDRVDGEYIIV